MTTPNKIIKNRSIDEISKENKNLLEKLKQNALELHTKKLNEKKEKEQKTLENILNSSRKLFGFHIHSKDQIDFEKTKNFVETLWKTMGKNINKFIYINNFIYIKSKENMKLTDKYLGITDSCKLEQINPHQILQLQ